MAVQTKQYCRISAHSELVLVVFMDYEDTDYQTVNDEGEPDDFKVIRFHGTNYSVYPKTVTTFKANGGVMWVRTIPAGESFSVNAGGLVKHESDIPVWAYA
jgi:hypothetical protein